MRGGRSALPDCTEAGEKLVCGPAAADWFAGKRPRDLLALPGVVLPPATERPFTVWASAEDKVKALNR